MPGVPASREVEVKCNGSGTDVGPSEARERKRACSSSEGKCRPGVVTADVGAVEKAADCENSVVYAAYGDGDEDSEMQETDALVPYRRLDERGLPTFGRDGVEDSR